MERRLFKQLVIGGVYLVVFALIGWGAYAAWFKPAPTCFDNIRNQSEEDVDCGGVCEPCGKRTVKPLELVSQRTLSVSPGVYDFIARLRNPNALYGAERFRYTVRWFGAGDQVLAERGGTAYILPRGTRSLIVQGVALSEPSAKTEVVLDAYNWVRLKEYQGEPRFLVRQAMLERVAAGEPGFAAASAVIVNKSGFNFQEVDINVSVLDAAGNVLAVSRTVQHAFTNDSERAFRVSWPDPFAGEPQRPEVEVLTNVFDDENYLQQFRPLERFQQTGE
ncbi:hypothetical protein HYW67_00590 [Candidatus Parcubacteria bacterium]|nr:hypothetical protein [Candidatus Parcubacteria bacterium]